MAEQFESEMFFLEDGEGDQGGGFGGFDDFSAENAPEPGNLEGEVNADEGDKPGEKAKPEEDDKKPEEVVKPEEAKATPIEDMNAKLLAQNETLATTVQAIVKANEKPAETVKPVEIIKPEFTEAEWEDDREGCTKAMFDHYRAVEKQDEVNQETARVAEANKNISALQASHNEGWGAVVGLVPELDAKTGSKELRDIYAEYFPKHQGDPLGTILAMKEMNADPRAKAILDAKPLENKSAGEGEPISPEKAAAQEVARQDRISKAAMSGGDGGKGLESGTKTRLDADQKKTCKMLGISEDSYAESLKAMGGLK